MEAGQLRISLQALENHDIPQSIVQDLYYSS